MRGNDLLSAVPVAATGTHLSPLPHGGGVLLRRAEAPAGFAGWLVRVLGLERAIRVELDAAGARYFRLVDGERPLAEIHRALCAELALPPVPARRAVIELTAALMRRNLLALRVERP